MNIDNIDNTDNIQERALRFCADRNVAPDELLNRAECGRFVDMTVGTLGVLASYRVGPPYRLAFGRAYYIAREVAVWLLQREPKKSSRVKAGQLRAAGDRDARARAALAALAPAAA